MKRNAGSDVERVKALEVLLAVVKAVGDPAECSKTVNLPNFVYTFEEAVGDVVSAMSVANSPGAASATTDVSKTSSAAVKQASEYLKGLFFDRPSVYHKLHSGHKVSWVPITPAGVLEVVREFEAMKSDQERRGTGVKQRSKPKKSEPKDDTANEEEDQQGGGAGGDGGPKTKKKSAIDTTGVEAPSKGGRPKKLKTAVPLPVFSTLNLAQGPNPDDDDDGVGVGAGAGDAKPGLGWGAPIETTENDLF
jgi:hypothetical protein